MPLYTKPKQARKNGNHNQKRERKRGYQLKMENSYSMEFLLLQEVQFLEVNDDGLSQWELVNVLDSEEGAKEDDDGDRVQQKEFGSWASLISWSNSAKTDPIDDIRCRLLHFRGPNLKGQHHDVDYGNGDCHLDNAEDENDGPQSGDGYEGGYGEDEDEDVDYYSGYDLDDELVPWSANGKIGRQRMRKLGKRGFSKMNNSKRSPYLFVRPGCVRGKHGLGLKHNY